MLYLMSIEKTNTDRPNYYMFETHTESAIVADSECMQRLINECKMEPKNMTLTSEGVQLKPWPQDVSKSYYKSNVYVLLAKVSEQKFKLIRGIDREVFYMTDQELKKYIESGSIINCSCENGIYKSADTYNITIDAEFEQYITRKYSEFRAKSIMLGLDMSFNYTIENKEVKIMLYTGQSRKIIIPNFITTITKNAFRSSNIQELKLSEGLKYIGINAFNNNNINHVEIPKTVQFVGYNAFERNPQLVGPLGKYRDTVKKLGSKTILL